jgi:sulfate adenylyltransferase large subunit
MDTLPISSITAEGVLRFATAGSVDDGKSTLIGRLLYDAQGLCEDQLAQVAQSSLRRGLAAPDLSLITDGLIAEREQGITIDVAYRYFATPKRKFIIADTPGHEQYTRNMVTGASTADLVIVLVDATRGVQTQSRRHAAIASLLGVPHLVVAINKMDRVDWSQARFESLKSDFAKVLAGLAFARIDYVPLAALTGDNVTSPSPAMPWYAGAPLLQLLEESRVARPKSGRLRLPVQWVRRPEGTHQHERIYMGRIESGRLAVGDEITLAPSGGRAKVLAIRLGEVLLNEAEAPRSIGVVLDRDIDVARGDIITHEHMPTATSVRAQLAWMDSEALTVGKRYALKAGTRTVRAVVATLHSRFNINTLQHEATPTLAINDIGDIELRLQAPIALDSYREARATGSFILIDETTHRTVGAGMVA